MTSSAADSSASPSDRRCRLLVFGYSLSGGGAERFTSTLLTHLNRERFEPQLVTLADEKSYSLPSDVPHVSLGHRGVWSLRRTVLRLRARIQELQPDVILSTFDLPTLFVGFAFAGRKKPCRWVARLALAVDRPAFSILDSLSRPLLVRCYRRVDHFVANSNGLAAAFAKKHPFAAEKLTTIHNPVDVVRLDSLAAEPPPLRRDEHRPLLIWAGRLHPQKRPDLLLDAYALLREEFHPQLWILGEGPLRSSLEARIAAESWQEDVKLLGFQSTPFPLLRQADLFLLTSDFEGLPNALLEAQALGVPAVATRADFGPDEIIEDNVTGKLVPRGDANSVATAVADLLRDRARLTSFAASARTLIPDRFGLAPLIANWQSILLPN